MGIDHRLTQALILERERRPYIGRAYTLGRQAMPYSPEITFRTFQDLGARPAISDLSEIRIDEATTTAREDPAQHRIRDVDFFAMLGLSETLAIDISDYEGAEILVDINQPIPSRLERSCCLLVDGSLLDNIFDPVTALKNISRMLTPGGRCFLINQGFHYSEHPQTYLGLNAMWFFDYFVWNDFDYCQVFNNMYGRDEDGKGNGNYDTVYALSYEQVSGEVGNRLVPWLRPPDDWMGITVYAEKGRQSTWDQIPTQAQYRSEHDWQRYRAIVDRYRAQNRPYLVTSGEVAKKRNGIPPGYLWVRSDGTTE